MPEPSTRATPPRVELLWWTGCPSTGGALEELRMVLAEAGLDPEEIDVREVETEEQAFQENFVGSPTIRINGRDIEDSSGQRPGLACRVYRLGDGRPSPTPDPEELRAAVRSAVAQRDF
jgi:glutaredoxin